MKPLSSIQSVLFDLDGTLLDTAHDLGAALNDLLQWHGMPTLSQDKIRPWAGRGSRGLIQLGFNIHDQDPRFAALSQQFMDLYADHVCRATQLFTGMEQVLTFLENNHISWGIVTNKPQRFTTPLIQHLQLHHRTTCAISGDSLEKRKPHPDPILHACQILQSDPKHCIYIGDTEIDMIASKAAGTFSLVALYGYIPHTETPSSWQADGFIRQPLDILDWIATP